MRRGCSGSGGREQREERGRGRPFLLSPKRNANHCGAMVTWACVGKRNVRVSAVLVQRSTGAPVVGCARRRVPACSIKDGRSSLSASTSDCIGVVGYSGEKVICHGSAQSTLDTAVMTTRVKSKISHGLLIKQSRLQALMWCLSYCSHISHAHGHQSS
jgi:hypothetical protein